MPFEVKAGSESISVSNKYIKCDWPYCQTQDNPTNQCGKCKKYYYCSKECQVSAWHHANHKKWCNANAKVRLELATIKSTENRQDIEAVNQECGICLDSFLDSNSGDKVVVLQKCRHGFCYGCIKQWEKQHNECFSQLMISGASKPEATCPLCRSTMEKQVDGVILDRAKLFKLRAENHKDKTEKDRILQLALDELERILQGKNISSNLELTEYQSNLNLQKAIAIQASIHLEMGKYEKVKEFAEWSLDHRVNVTLDQQLLLMLMRAEALLGLGRLDLAIRLCDDIADIKLGKSITIWIDTECSKFAARCWYEIGNWELARRNADIAILRERFHFGVHKYAAMSARAEGNILEAVEIMTKAVLYEIGDERGCMEENIHLLRQYQAEEKEKGQFLPYPYLKTRHDTLCGICGQAVREGQEMILGMCQHIFCIECLRGWWLQYAVDLREDANKICYKGVDASCPACRQCNGQCK